MLSVRSLATLILVACVLAAPVRAEEVVLRDGSAHDVTIIETTVDSISVAFEREGTKGTVVVRAEELDPHSFYSIRSRHMEKTAKNHLTLAKYCVENGLFSRAESQAEKARALDADYVERKMQLPGLVNGLAEDTLKTARDFFRKDDLENARRYASVVLTRFPENPSTEAAAKLIDRIETRIAKDEEKKQAAALEAAEKADAANAGKARAAYEEHLKPLSQAYTKARQLNIEALRETSPSKQVKMFETAARNFESLIKKGKAAEDKYAQSPSLQAELQRAINTVTQDAVEAWINAGGVELSRGSLKNARDYGGRALSLAPNSARARSFMNRVELAAATSDKYQRGRVRR